MSKLKFKTPYNAASFPKQIEVIDPKRTSTTVPNQSMTITEIYRRYASGRSLSGVRQPIHDDDGNRQFALSFDDYLPNLETIDLADRQAMMETAKAHLEDVKKRLDAYAKAQKQKREEVNNDLKKRIKELESRLPNEPAPKKEKPE